MKDSPVKKIDFKSEDKENMPSTDVASLPVAIDDVKKPIPEEVKPEAPKVAPTIKELEAEEPLLRENPNRFVLFPLKVLVSLQHIASLH
jgi:ribonucleoside-diphosphate reductase subunit M2